MSPEANASAAHSHRAAPLMHSHCAAPLSGVPSYARSGALSPCCTPDALSGLLWHEERRHGSQRPVPRCQLGLSTQVRTKPTTMMTATARGHRQPA